MATPFPGMMNWQMGLNSQPVHIPYGAGLPQGGQPGYQQMPAPDWQQWLNSNVPGGSGGQQPGFMANPWGSQSPQSGFIPGNSSGVSNLAPGFNPAMQSMGQGNMRGGASSPYQSANLQGLLSLLQHPALQQAMGGLSGMGQLPGSMGGSAPGVQQAMGRAVPAMAESAPGAGQLGYGRMMNQQPQASLASLLGGRGRASRGQF